jgi:hypothetical protein
MNKITDSIIATNGSQISNVKIKKKSYFGIQNKQSFLSGFVVGIISSVIASGAWYLIQKYLIE